ncbi:hypothetical protein DIPPA_28450 [Diplonema papillatum]|nr:hypothetical protein DIPPA_23989 [Diplonema papillatum]KAJ9437765.1 hypothetical protein DIPPA_16667 [Diplonema papillatum]KAJ9437873.1 hypothetical protein DIPPA_26962 [Diplonema papillatum]KAJ9442291.1 hypothetical protein DIPPA_33837 [Diplonema papillatum]KAJ9452238.1 hypothetical protein DIPPA_07064 [Diplonema papillatum]
MTAAIEYCATTPVQETQRMRGEFLTRWKKRSLQLPPLGAGPCHVDLLEEMLRDLDIRGADALLRHLRTGCPMSGVVGYEEIYSPGPPGEPEITEEELLRRQPDVLARSTQAIRADSLTNKEAVWRSVRRELEAGFIVELRNPPANTVYMRRFVIRQVKSDEHVPRVKERACDDGRMSLINKAVRMATPVKLDTVDVYAEVCRRVARGALARDPRAEFKSVGLDHKDAYRQLHARNDRLCRCVVAEDPATGRIGFFRMERLSFGEAAAVVHYNAFAKVLARVVRKGLKLPLCQYYDDFASPCQASDGTALADVLELLQGILHTSFNEDKTSEGHSFRHLGLVFTITSRGVEVAISAPRRRGLVQMLKGVMARDSLSPGEAASLAGKLGFATSALFGRVGRVPLQPIFRRSNASTTFAGFKLGGDLEEALGWWVRTLAEDEQCFRRTVPLNPIRPGEGTRYVLLTDACLFGLGAVLATITEGVVVAVEYFSHPVPREGANLQIHHLEFVAVAVAFALWFGDKDDYTVSVWVDNDIILGSLVQGRTRAKELRTAVHLFWERLARSRGNAWFDRVPGIDNIADLPSRLLHAWAGVPIRGILPRRREVDQRVADAAIAEVL